MIQSWWPYVVGRKLKSGTENYIWGWWECCDGSLMTNLMCLCLYIWHTLLSPFDCVIWVVSLSLWTLNVCPVTSVFWVLSKSMNVLYKAKNSQNYIHTTFNFCCHINGSITAKSWQKNSLHSTNKPTWSLERWPDCGTWWRITIFII